MARLLFLPHRLPYPPDKGDKIRSYHLLRHLAARHEVTLATFVDDTADEVHLPTVRRWCSEAVFARLRPRLGRLKSAAALLAGGPMTLHYYRDAGLLQKGRELVARQRFDAVVVFSSSMMPYAEAARGVAGPRLPILLDLVDVDSAKWTAYAPRHRWPLSWPLAREGRTLLAYERHAVAQASASFLCTEQERELFFDLAPESRGHVDVLRNGVDADLYCPDPARASPFPPAEQAVVFTGAMDYWPNVDAVCWFARDMLGPLRRRLPTAHFYIVGRNPAPAVRQLAGDTVTVTGTVPDVRPYLQHAAAVVAPLRVARGIQNKILEAMAMRRPVVAAASCVAALDPAAGRHLVAAVTAQDYVAALQQLLAEPARAAAMGAAGRAHVLAAYSWAQSMRVLDDRLVDALRWRGSEGGAFAPPPRVAAVVAGDNS